MNDTLQWILLVWLLTVIATSVCTIFSINKLDNFVSTPKDLYDTTNFNWLGVMLLYILYVLIFPLMFIFKIIYWIFHAGRRD